VSNIILDYFTILLSTSIITKYNTAI